MNLETRTKEVILRAMLDLTKEKRVDKITVQDVIARAEISRQTFYNYFKDKYDLMNYAYVYDTKAVYTKYARTHDLEDFYYEIACTLKQNAPFYRHMIRMQGQNNFIQYMHDHTKQFYLEEIQYKNKGIKIDEKLSKMIDFLIHGANNLCYDWIMEDSSLSPEEMTQLLMDCMPPKLKELLC